MVTSSWQFSYFHPENLLGLLDVKHRSVSHPAPKAQPSGLIYQVSPHSISRDQFPFKCCQQSLMMAVVCAHNKLWFFVFTCLQFSGWWFSLWSQFSDGWKKHCWFSVCSAFLLGGDWYSKLLMCWTRNLNLNPWLSCPLPPFSCFLCCSPSLLFLGCVKHMLALCPHRSLSLELFPQTFAWITPALCNQFSSQMPLHHTSSSQPQ